MTEVFDFDGDNLFIYVPIQGHSNISEKHLVITKDIFKECYKRWVLEAQKEE